MIDEFDLFQKSQLRTITTEQVKLLTQDGKLIYSYFDATGQSLRNAKAAVRKYLPTKALTQWGALAMQIDDSDVYSESGINVEDITDEIETAISSVTNAVL